MNGLFLWKTKKGITTTNAFQNILWSDTLPTPDTSGCKPNKIWEDEGSEFYNISIYQHKMEVNMLLLKGFNKLFLRNKICKYMTSISKNVYADKLELKK